MKTILGLALPIALLCSTAALAEVEQYTVIYGGTNIGHLNADTEGRRTTIDFDYKNNGRGPTIAETIEVDAAGLPTLWTMKGTTTFGSTIDESFSLKGGTAAWTDSVGKDSRKVTTPSIYVAQSASPWALGLYVKALIKDADGTMPALPGGTLRIEKGESFTVEGAGGPVNVTQYTLSGINTTPDSLLIDDKGQWFGGGSPDFAIVRKGYEGEEKRLRDLFAKWSTDRYVAIQKEVAHDYKAPVRIRNVRLFDPKTAALTAPVSVLVNGHEIASVEPLDSPATPGEVTIDGAGGTLVPGLFEMHGHIGQDDALLNLIAGITTVRDMGNDNEVLEGMIERIEGGVIAGPRIVRSGFIEGKSPYSSNNGIVVASEAEAVDAVRWYAARGYWQVKVYNSMNPAWVPAVVKEAHRLGLRVAGHVPAFSSADAVIEAGYDEVTHINQFMLGWVLKPDEDTRQLLRLTALKRFEGFDLTSPKVQQTIQLMIDHKTAIDPTIGIHEQLTQNRDGQVPPGAVDYLDHMPVGYQRDAKKQWIAIDSPADDRAYRAAYKEIIATLKLLNDRGVLIVPGTDTGGSFTFHRELELFQEFGMTPPQILKRATWEMAQYLGQDQRLGSIEKGKLADFFLIPGDPTRDLKAIKSIAMVVKDGVFYYPSEVYPKFGIEPFAAAPKVTVPNQVATR